MMSKPIEELLEQIVSVNHAWKLSREEFGNKFVATTSFLSTKSSLQATLLRDFPGQSYLVLADDNDRHDEVLFSVRLTSPIRLSKGVKHDAEHLPVRVAKELFTESELTQIMARNKQ
jgi:hypothetical protein